MTLATVHLTLFDFESALAGYRGTETREKLEARNPAIELQLASEFLAPEAFKSLQAMVDENRTRIPKDGESKSERVTSLILGRDTADYTEQKGSVFFHVDPELLTEEFRELFKEVRSIPRTLFAVQAAGFSGARTMIRVATLPNSSPQDWELRVTRGESNSNYLGDTEGLPAHAWATLYVGDSVELFNTGVSERLRMLLRLTVVGGPFVEWGVGDGDSAWLETVPVKSELERERERVAAEFMNAVAQLRDVKGWRWRGLWQGIGATQILLHSQSQRVLQLKTILATLATEFGDDAERDQSGGVRRNWARGFEPDQVLLDAEDSMEDLVASAVENIRTNSTVMGAAGGVWPLYAALRGVPAAREFATGNGVGTPEVMVAVARAFSAYGIEIRGRRHA